MDISVDKVVIDEENSQSLKEDTKALNSKYIIETSDQELEEELSQQLKDIGEEVEYERLPPKEKEDTEVNMEAFEEPPLVGTDKGPIQEEEVPPVKEGEKKKEKKEDAP